jgi:proline iminopeptidase
VIEDAGRYQIRNFIIRTSVTHIVLLGIQVLPGIQYTNELFTIWATTMVFVLLSKFFRPLILALTLPFTIMTGGLFIFVIDGILLLLTDLVTGLEIAGFGWAILGSVVMSMMNIWVQSGFKRLGWMEREDEDDPKEIGEPSMFLKILLGIGLLFGIGFSLSTATQVIAALSTVTDSLWILGAAGAITLAMVAYGVAWLVAEGYESNRRARFGGIISGLTTATTLGALWIVLALPVPPPTQTEPPPNTAYWQLSTGSRLAYYHYPAQGQPQETPIVFLHNGPGLAVMDYDRTFYRQFAEDGFDVYLYDQVGSGHSERLENIRDYGMARNLADLDAIRSTLGVNELILIGHGAGAELAARYLSRYPERVKQVILHSPTALVNHDQIFYSYVSTASPIGPNPVFELRLYLAASLSTYGPDAAEKLASQAEMSLLLEQGFNPGTLVCGGYGDQVADIEPGKFNTYVQIQAEYEAQTLPDPQPDLQDNLTPSLILVSECDYVPWEVIEQYADALLNEQIFYIEDAGHVIQLSRSQLAAHIIRAFLVETSYPIEPYSNGNPRPLLGP